MADLFSLPPALDLGGASARLERNLDALRILARLDGAPASPEEQAALALYSGWGDTAVRKGAVNVDGEAHGAAVDLIGGDDLESLNRSVLSAFYTPLVVVRAIWAGLARLGLGEVERPLILEPALGVGNFVGAAPAELRARARFVGVELDRITARIAAALYPEIQLHACGFEAAPLPANTFDVVVGNVPFGDFGVFDPTIRPKFLTGKIHDYFIAKSLTLLRPNGVLALVTTHGTLDKESRAVRAWLAARAELVGAIRLPNTTFEGGAGTKVVTDIIFLRRLPAGAPGSKGWVNSSNVTRSVMGDYGDASDRTFLLNSYYSSHPRQILGELAPVQGRYGVEITVKPRKKGELADHLAEALKTLPVNVMGRLAGAAPLRLVGGGPNASGEGEQKAPELWAVYLAAKRVLELQAQDVASEEVDAARAALNASYDAARTHHKGPLTRSAKGRGKKGAPVDVLRGLPVHQFLMALEGPDGAPAAIFRERTTRAILDPGVMALASNALYVCLDRKGVVDLDWIAAAVGRSRESAELELAGQIFRTPAGEWETADAYLSGNVRKKLLEARALLPLDPSMAPNVAALEAALPPPLTAGDIQVRLGAGWIPEEVVVEFVAHLIPTATSSSYSALRARYLEVTAEWFLEGMPYEARRSLENTQRWGSPRRSAEDLILDCLNSKIPVITDAVEYFEDGKARTKQVRNNDETLVAQGKLQDIKDAWSAWIWADAARADRLVQIYNEKFNGFRVRQFDGSHLTFPGLTERFTPYAAQLAAVARALRASQDNPAYIHEVGAGKTAAGVMTAVKSIQLGLARRVMVVVPKHLVGQWRDAFTTLFPGELDRLMVADDDSFKKEHRAAFLAKIATSNAAYVVVTYEQFKVIPLSEKVLTASLDAELAEVRAERENMKEAHATTAERAATKRLEGEFKRREAAVEKYRVAFKGRAAAATREDNRVVSFEDLAVDLLLVDESQALKNDWVHTKMTNVAGLARAESQRAFDARLKIHHMLGNNGRVVFLTGTPVTNTVAELFVIMRFLQPALLRELGLYHFDAWVGTFAEVYASVEMDSVGAFRTQSRLRYGNLPELMNLLGQSWDRATVPDAMRPRLAGGQMTVIKVPGSPALRLLNTTLARRAAAIRAREVPPEIDNMLLVTSDGRRGAFTNGPWELGFIPGVWTKVDAVAVEVKRLHAAYAKDRAAQLIFCDLFTPRGREDIATAEEEPTGDDEKPLLPGDMAVEGVYGVIRRKLVAAGIPDEEIAYIHSAKTGAAKDALFAAVRSGKIRVLMGSTAKMGTGMNVQDRLIALHHLDCPWRPADLEQRVGRIQRQGNMYSEVHVFAYVTEGSYDPVNWQFIEMKARFIRQIMAGGVGSRTADDIGDVILTYALAKAIALGDGRIIERVKMESELLGLSKKYRAWVSDQVEMLRTIQHSPAYISSLEGTIGKLEALRGSAQRTQDQAFAMTVWSYSRQGMVTTSSRTEANALFMEMMNAWLASARTAESKIPRVIGTYRGLTLSFSGTHVIATHRMGGFVSGAVGADTVRSLNFNLGRITVQIDEDRLKLEQARTRMASANALASQGWLHATKARELLASYEELVRDTPALGAGQVFGFSGLN